MKDLMADSQFPIPNLQVPTAFWRRRPAAVAGNRHPFIFPIPYKLVIPSSVDTTLQSRPAVMGGICRRRLGSWPAALIEPLYFPLPPSPEALGSFISLLSSPGKQAHRHRTQTATRIGRASNLATLLSLSMLGPGLRESFLT